MRIGQKASYPAVGADCRNRLSYVRPNRYEVCLCWCTVAPNREPTFLFLPNLFTPPPFLLFLLLVHRESHGRIFFHPPGHPPRRAIMDHVVVGAHVWCATPVSCWEMNDGFSGWDGLHVRAPSNSVSQGSVTSKLSLCFMLKKWTPTGKQHYQMFLDQ